MKFPLRVSRLVVLLFLGQLVQPPHLLAGDEALLSAIRTRLPPAQAAGQIANGGRGGADAVQAQYNAARDLQEALRAAQPVSGSCRALLRAAEDFALAAIMQVEGYDRPWPPLIRAGVQKATEAQAAITRMRGTCRRSRAPTRRATRELASPRSGEVFFGEVKAFAPEGSQAAVADIQLGRQNFRVDVRDDRLAWRIPSSMPPGRYDLVVRFRYLDRSESLVPNGTAVSRGVWLLPRSAMRATPERSTDRKLAVRLATLARTFDGYAGFWVHNLSTGQTAAWNSEARFPAASTVKLAVLIAALARFGPSPERSSIADDLKALTQWSSNAASNRLLIKLGGSEAGGSRIAQGVLNRLGATSSTYTGNYRLGTSAKIAIGVRQEPPRVSSRVTTAHDLARMLFALHAGALGDRPMLRQLGLSAHEAKVGLGYLLSWQAPPPGDNVGSFRPALGPSTPVAQKNGWFSAVRHTAAIVYTENGPTIVACVTYRPGITLRDAQTLGKRMLERAGLTK